MAAVVDVTQEVVRDRDYRLTVEDLKAWETRHGRIPKGAIVLMYTGWGRHWPDKVRYLGSDTPGDTANLHFLGISRGAAEFLAIQRKIDGVGINTASLNHGPSKDFIVHRLATKHAGARTATAAA